MDYIASPATVIPLLLLLILIIYYLVSLTNALREANQDLKNQLRRERQEERKKMMQRVATSKMDDNGNGSHAMDRWRKVLEASSPLTPTVPGQNAEPDEEKMQARKELLARIMKKALRKGSNTSEDESHDGGGDDETDTEQHESLPHDHDGALEPKSALKRKESNKHLDSKRSDSKPRKSSFARMIIDASKKAEAAAAAAERQKISKARSPDKTEGDQSPLVADDDNEELKAKVVSERRMLRRQQSMQESEASTSVPRPKPTPDKDDVNYEVVNEKNKAVEKKAKQKIKVKVEPEVFKFDNETLRKDNMRDEMEDEDANCKTFADIPSKDKTSLLSNSSSSSKTSFDHIYQTPYATSSGAVKKDKHRHKIADGDRSSDKGSDISQHQKEKQPPTYASIIKPKSDAKSKSETKLKSDARPLKEKPKEQEEPLKPLEKPIKKMNSFLALVREAVQAKKQEPPPIPDLPSQVKKYIDDSISISEDGSITKNSDSQSSQIVRRSSSKKKPSKPKRQDSQASIWSDNIPVITISKTESDECILEKSTDEADDHFDDGLN